MMKWLDLPNSTVPIAAAALVALGTGVWIQRALSKKSTTKPVHNKGPNDLVVTQINVYPVKSCRGISLKTGKVGKYGLLYDRNWMIVRAEDGRFVTQRQNPRLALIRTSFESDAFLCLDAPEMPTLRIPLQQARFSEEELKERTRIATVWAYTGPAVDQGEEAATWLSTFLQTPDLRLVRIPPNHGRGLPENYQLDESPESVVSFADGFPFLLASEESLDDLNNRLKERGHSPIEMRRFRPNIVIRGAGKPFIEDIIKRIQINGISFVLRKKCSRCKITTIDPEKGEYVDKEPLDVLATFRKGLLEGGKEVCFGENLVHLQTG